MRVAIQLLVSLVFLSSCQQCPSQRYFHKTLKTVQNKLFVNDTTWHNDRFKGTLTRCVKIYKTDERKMNELVSEFNKFYTLVYYGDRDAVFNAYNYPDRCTNPKLLELQPNFLGYATDFTHVAIFRDDFSLILVGFHSSLNLMVICEPYYNQ